MLCVRMQVSRDAITLCAEGLRLHDGRKPDAVTEHIVGDSYMERNVSPDGHAGRKRSVRRHRCAQNKRREEGWYSKELWSPFIVVLLLRELLSNALLE